MNPNLDEHVAGGHDRGPKFRSRDLPRIGGLLLGELQLAVEEIGLALLQPYRLERGDG
jgi:hypothetical protein